MALSRACCNGLGRCRRGRASIIRLDIRLDRKLRPCYPSHIGDYLGYDTTYLPAQEPSNGCRCKLICAWLLTSANKVRRLVRIVRKAQPEVRHRIAVNSARAHSRAWWRRVSRFDLPGHNLKLGTDSTGFGTSQGSIRQQLLELPLQSG